MSQLSSQLSIYLQVIAPRARRLTTVTTALALALAPMSFTPGSAQPQPQQVPQEPMQGAPQLTPAQLDQLVSPIALYPDNLLGQVLSASTYPLEIVMAARWASANPNVTGPQLEAAMQAQPWDPSVKAMAAVPQALAMMSEKLEWTQQLGEAYLSQPDDIAASVQRLRARADASGNLKTSEQIRVKRVVAERPLAAMGPEYIVIEPVVPERIYVPVYDPFRVYGAWAYPDYPPPYYYSPPGYVGVGIFGFGAAVVVGAALWATYNWGARRVYANPVMYASYNRVSITTANRLAAAPLVHDPAHRGTLAYRNPGLQTQYGRAATLNTTTNVNRTTVGGSGTPQQRVLSNTTNTGPGSPKGRSTTTNITNTTVNNNLTVNKNTTTRNVIGNTTGNATSGNTTGSRTVNINTTGSNTTGTGSKNTNIGNTTAPRNATNNANRNISLGSGAPKGPPAGPKGGNISQSAPKKK